MIGQTIKKAIEASSLSADQVAAHAEMSVANLYKIYKRDSVESRYLIKIAEALHLPVEHFLYDQVAEEKAIYNIRQNGIGNAGSNSYNQKITHTGNQDTTTPGSVSMEELTTKLLICESEKAGLLEQLKLKDQLLAMKDELIQQLKK
ncbi:hypothetical protein AHMF7605_26200 [Adhaeribacter arboris]|uniref:HTH cro/C1-type domain-containing protein n=1 Tax=Adhaeribacter arboris TaxID=2072846 RepID=A0A2T2YMK6_9BACT|nr:hypothetical protein [Adhaeribacter arboris]PSR56738.1 hypothetical protein AHMF7605_26200 [Adhaeribacter arboris]